MKKILTVLLLVIGATHLAWADNMVTIKLYCPDGQPMVNGQGQYGALGMCYYLDGYQRNFYCGLMINNGAVQLPAELMSHQVGLFSAGFSGNNYCSSNCGFEDYRFDSGSFILQGNTDVNFHCLPGSGAVGS